MTALATPYERLELEAIAYEIHRTWADAKAHQIAAWDGYFLTGRLLADARERFPGDREYGHWFASQGFAFTTEWARRLMLAAAHEHDARAVLATAVASRPPGVNAVLGELGLMGDGRLPAAGEGAGPEAAETGFWPRAVALNERLGAWQAAGGRDEATLFEILYEAEALEAEAQAVLALARLNIHRAFPDARIVSITSWYTRVWGRGPDTAQAEAEIDRLIAEDPNTAVRVDDLLFARADFPWPAGTAS